MIYRFLLLWIVTLLPVMAAAQQSRTQDAASVLEATVHKLNAAPSVHTSFTLTANGQTLKGVMTAAGRCFYIKSDGGEYETWFDGKTQWTWSAATNEVNMTEPTPEEIMETNPFAIATEATKIYNVSLVGKDGPTVLLRLTPKRGAATQVAEAVLKIALPSNFPAELKVTLKDRQVLSFCFNDMAVGKKLDVREFKYDPSKHPGAEIIDLR